MISYLTDPIHESIMADCSNLETVYDRFLLQSVSIVWFVCLQEVVDKWGMKNNPSFLKNLRETSGRDK